jgi:hypothetical protein
MLNAKLGTSVFMILQGRTAKLDVARFAAAGQRLPDRKEKHSREPASFEVALRNAAVIERIVPVGFVAK